MGGSRRSGRWRADPGGIRSIRIRSISRSSGDPARDSPDRSASIHRLTTITVQRPPLVPGRRGRGAPLEPPPSERDPDARQTWRHVDSAEAPRQAPAELVAVQRKPAATEVPNQRRPCPNDHAAGRDFPRRHSSVDNPAHTPTTRGTCDSANDRHSPTTGQPAHTAFAAAVDSPRSGKNTAWSWPRQAASSCHHGRPISSSSGTGGSDRHNGVGADFDLTSIDAHCRIGVSD